MGADQAALDENNDDSAGATLHTSTGGKGRLAWSTHYGGMVL